MATAVYEGRRGLLKHLSTWLQAIGLVYLIGSGMVFLGAIVGLIVREPIELMPWIAGLMR
jgi:hypothetical protein